MNRFFFSLLRDLRDGAGCVAFTALHVPIYTLLSIGLFGDDGGNNALIAGMDAFFVVHIVLRNHP